MADSLFFFWEIRMFVFEDDNGNRTGAVTLGKDEVDRIIDRAKWLAMNEWKAAWASANNHMHGVEFHVRRAQTAFSDIEIMLGREPSPPLEF